MQCNYSCTTASHLPRHMQIHSGDKPFSCIQLGGGTKYECWNPKWISMSFQYIRSGKKEFLNLVTVLTLHIDPQYLKNHYIRVKSQSCRRPMVWPIKTCARKALSQPKKNRINRTYQLREKSKKLPENSTFLENRFADVWILTPPAAGIFSFGCRFKVEIWSWCKV